MSKADWIWVVGWRRSGQAQASCTVAHGMGDGAKTMAGDACG